MVYMFVLCKKPKVLMNFRKKISITIDTHETANNMFNMHEAVSGNKEVGFRRKYQYSKRNYMIQLLSLHCVFLFSLNEMFRFHLP